MCPRNLTGLALAVELARGREMPRPVEVARDKLWELVARLGPVCGIGIRHDV